MPIPVKNENQPRLSAKEKVYRTLAEWITDGTLTAGEKLNEEEIAAYFSVSRTPVREALQQLAANRLVEVLPSKGSYVTRIEEQNAREVYEALAAVTGFEARLACQKRTDADLAELQKRSDAFKAAVNAGNWAQLPQLDEAFHGYISQIAGNPYLSDYRAALTLHACRCERLLAAQTQDRAASVADHEALISAIRYRDEQRAERIACRNWLGVYEAQLKDVIRAENQRREEPR